MKPVARRNDLVVKRDTGELFIEDVINQKYIYLNPTSAYVWDKCDGQRDANQIATEMGSELGVSVSEKVVQMVMRRLEGERLVVCV
ncbi:MAG: PqqD family protein [Acidobacteria bacterium]|nr:PqqD family protein [Acidobacteriota bacterium]MBK8148296.1 PqqD family protein [Acidobacteriota bacterium]MBK8813424.1 PqqD family protein [Acidobacteriota bacterium]